MHILQDCKSLFFKKKSMKQKIEHLKKLGI